MGSQTTARMNIMTAAAALQAAWTDYPLLIEADNRDVVDQATQQDPYLQVSIQMIKGEQLDMADRPLVEQRGQILICAVAKAGSGSAGTAKLLDFCESYFDMKELGIVRCHAFEAQKARANLGWYYAPAIVNFWFVRTSN